VVVMTRPVRGDEVGMRRLGSEGEISCDTVDAFVQYSSIKVSKG
jgi:hypothetical protein